MYIKTVLTYNIFSRYIIFPDRIKINPHHFRLHHFGFKMDLSFSLSQSVSLECRKKNETYSRGYVTHIKMALNDKCMLWRRKNLLIFVWCYLDSKLNVRICWEMLRDQLHTKCLIVFSVLVEILPNGLFVGNRDALPADIYTLQKQSVQINNK